MRSHGMKLRRKWSQMPCNLVIFIWVNRKSEVRRGQQQGQDTRKKEEKKKERKRDRKKERSEVKQPQQARKGVRGGIGCHQHGFGEVQRCPVGSVSMEEWRFRQGRDPAARPRGGEKESSEEHVLSFYRGICPCAICAVRAIHAACLDKSSLAVMRPSPLAVLAKSFRSFANSVAVKGISLVITWGRLSLSSSYTYSILTNGYMGGGLPKVSSPPLKSP